MERIMLRDEFEAVEELGFDEIEFVEERDEAYYFVAVNEDDNEVEIEIDYRGGIWIKKNKIGQVDDGLDGFLDID